MLSQWYFCLVKRRWNTILPRFEGAHRAHWKASSLELCFAEIWMIRDVREWSEYKAGSSLGWRNWFYYFNERWWRIASDQQETQYTSNQPSLIRKHEIKLAFLPPQPPVNILNLMNELSRVKFEQKIGIYWKFHQNLCFLLSFQTFYQSWFAHQKVSKLSESKFDIYW